MNIKLNSKVALTALSNSFGPAQRQVIELTVERMRAAGLKPVLSRYIYHTGDDSLLMAAEKASEFNQLISGGGVAAVFDISGGDLSNLVLESLDYSAFRSASIPFFGYSDLSTVLNALLVKADVPVYYYCARQLGEDASRMQYDYFRENIVEHDLNGITFNVKPRRGSAMSGPVFGGNIRCFLKLAGTVYFPDLTGKILFLESYSGGLERIASLFHQINQLDVFSRISGLLLGNFTQLQRSRQPQAPWEIARPYAEKNGFPVFETDKLGHGPLDRCLPMGVSLSFI